MQHIQEVEELFQSKRKNGEKLYVLLDGACWENAFGLIFSLPGVEEYRSLYVGTRYASVLKYGPVLVNVRPLGEFFQWFFEQGPSCHAGGFFFSSSTVTELHAQFQEFLEARMPNGSKALFRFYDPRITKRALILLSDHERENFRRGISAYYISRHKPDGASYWTEVLRNGGGNG
ncbi:MAG: DUF4123 domain-containing protein [Desulfovibrionaceae bacterium]|nr:DUF4123 domain-containing protein [Desulfovibrionaceae bacterium]